MITVFATRYIAQSLDPSFGNGGTQRLIEWNFGDNYVVAGFGSAVLMPDGGFALAVNFFHTGFGAGHVLRIARNGALLWDNGVFYRSSYENAWVTHLELEEKTGELRVDGHAQEGEQSLCQMFTLDGAEEPCPSLH